MQYHPTQTSFKMGLAIILLLATTLLSTSHAEFAADNPIRLPTPPHYGRNPEKINCQSFRLGVEANNLRDWETVPSYCKSYIKSYLSGKQYNLDIEAMTIAAVQFAETVPLPKDLRTNVWVFDLDETLLSNLAYFNSSKVQYGTLPINYTSLYEWIASENSTAPPLPAVGFLYRTVLALGFKTVIISEAPEYLKDVRISDLKAAGYAVWEDLIFKGEDDNNLSNYEFKYKTVRDLVVKKRYRIVATVGDQWSDLTGPHAGIRTFKVPNPVYYKA